MHRRLAPAFTLLELILVLLIMAVLLSVVAPSLQRFYTARMVEDAAGHLAAICRQARIRAIDEARQYRLHVDPGDREYWLTRETDGQHGRLETELGRTFQWDERLEATWEGGTRSGDGFELTFYPDGRTQPMRMRFEDRTRREAVTVLCESISEPFRIVRSTEEVDLVTHP